MLSDLRFAFRSLRKSPGFVLVAVLTLALGIGANTAIFSIVNAILLAPLPYPDSNRIVQVAETPNTGGFASAAGGVFMDWQDHTTQLESIAALHPANKNLTGQGEPVRLSGAEVTADYLRVLRVNPALGRGFTAADDAPGGDRHVVIVTHELWQSQLRGDPSVVGQPLHLDGETYNLIGVLPPNALLAGNVSFLIPAAIRADGWKQIRDYNYVCFVIGRLKPGASLAQATAELVAAKHALNASYPSYKQAWTVTVRPLQDALFGNSRPTALILLAAVGLVLLIACANVANLLLARAASRQGEIAVRAALGATRGRIVRQLLTESLLLAFLGGAAGIWLGQLAIPSLTAFTGLQALPGLTVAIDGRVLTFTLLASLGTGVLFGLFPALSSSRPNLQEDLKEGARGSTGGSRRRLQSALIVAETALTVVLLVSAGLLLRSFTKAMNADAGFARDNITIFTLSQPGSKAPTSDHRVRFTDAVLRQLAAIPGVARVGVVSSTPMNGNNYFGDLVSREDRPETRNDLNAGFDSVSGDFFQAIGIPLLRGRTFTAADNAEKAPKVMIVNDALARRLFADEDPIGRLLHFKNATWEIVGVVGSIRRFQLDVDPGPQVYYPQIHFPWQTTYVVRSHVPPHTLTDDIRRAVHAVDAEQPIAGLQTLEQSVARSLQGRRVVLTLLVIFAATALALACVGIYGVMAYSVAQRTREIGIRLALGADTTRVIGLILREALRLVVIGLGVGLLGSGLAGTLIYAQLYRATLGDPFVVFAAVAVILLGVALLACWLPARRATHVDPVVALRAD